MKIVHISKYRRFGPQGVRLGGVAKHAWHLQRAIPELELFAWEDLPNWQEYELGSQDWDKAPLLNQWLLGQGAIDKDTIVICDGWWGMGLKKKVARLISVCHGSYAGAMVEHMKNPWDDGFLLGQSVRYQENFWRNSGCEIIAVSPGAARELRLLADLNSVVISNGIDLNIFKPMGERKKGLILEATGGHPAKGAKVIEELKGMGYYIEPFGVQDGNLEHEAARWSEAEIAFFPSCYEGNSYAMLEAMACGCKIVVYWTGFVLDLPLGADAFTDDHHPVAFAHCLDMALSSDQYDMPAHIRDDLDFEYFARAWRDYASPD